MKRIILFSLLLLCSAALVKAEIYTWTDEQGVVTYTDNPARIPSRYGTRAQSGEIITIRSPTVLKGVRRSGNKQLQATIPHNRIKSIQQSSEQQNTVPLGMQSEIKGHLGGDQKDPAPPSMKQPKPVPVGVQPKPEPSGMEQPKPEPLGDQPKQTPSGMQQPKPVNPGAQPPATSSGMEQPDAKF